MVSSMLCNVGNLQTVCQRDAPPWLVTRQRHDPILSALPFQKTPCAEQGIAGAWDSNVYAYFNHRNTKMGVLFMNVIGFFYSWKTWGQLRPAVERSLPTCAPPSSVLLGSPRLLPVCFSQTFTQLELGGLKITSQSKHNLQTSCSTTPAPKTKPTKQNPTTPQPGRTCKKMEVRALKLTGEWEEPQHPVLIFSWLIQDPWTAGDGNAVFINSHLLMYSRKSLPEQLLNLEFLLPPPPAQPLGSEVHKFKFLTLQELPAYFSIWQAALKEHTVVAVLECLRGLRYKQNSQFIQQEILLLPTELPWLTPESVCNSFIYFFNS